MLRIIQNSTSGEHTRARFCKSTISVLKVALETSKVCLMLGGILLIISAIAYLATN